MLPHPVDCIWFGDRDDVKGSNGPLPVGGCFFGGYSLSNHYKNNVAQIRKPISVIVPLDGGDLSRGTWFCIDASPTASPDGNWDVTVDLESLVIGGKPMITVNPSIHCVGIWHGWPQNGVLHQ